MHSLAETRRVQHREQAERLRAVRHQPVSPDAAARTVVQVATLLLGFALFAAVAGVAVLVADGNAELAGAIRGWGLLAGAVLAVGGSMLINKRRTVR